MFVSQQYKKLRVLCASVFQIILTHLLKGKHQIARNPTYYSLSAMISIGFRLDIRKTIKERSKSLIGKVHDL